MTDQQLAADKSIGNLIAEANNLTTGKLSKVLAHQRSTGQKFGEAAVDLASPGRRALGPVATVPLPYAADGHQAS